MYVASTYNILMMSIERYVLTTILNNFIKNNLVPSFEYYTKSLIHLMIFLTLDPLSDISMDKYTSIWRRKSFSHGSYSDGAADQGASQFLLTSSPSIEYQKDK